MPRGRSPGTPGCARSAAATRARRCCCARWPGSRSPAAAKPSTVLPLAKRTEPSSVSAPSGSVVPVSSANSRRAHARGSSSVVVLALGDRPRAAVLLGPERAAGMDEQHLRRAVRGAPPEQDAGALSASPWAHSQAGPRPQIASPSRLRPAPRRGAAWNHGRSTCRRSWLVMEAVRCKECGETRWSLFPGFRVRALEAPCELCGGETVVERRRPGAPSRPAARRARGGPSRADRPRALARMSRTRAAARALATAPRKVEPPRGAELTARLHLRPFTAADERRSTRSTPTPRSCATSATARTGRPPRRRRALRTYADILAARGYSFVAVCERDTGALVGDAGLHPLGGTGPDVELGYTLARAAWGRGYATELGRALVEHAFGTLARAARRGPGGAGQPRVAPGAREARADRARAADGLRPPASLLRASSGPRTSAQAARCAARAAGDRGEPVEHCLGEPALAAHLERVEPAVGAERRDPVLDAAGDDGVGLAPPAAR